MQPIDEAVETARAFEPLIAAGYLRIVYGAAAEGQYLVHHASVWKLPPIAWAALRA